MSAASKDDSSVVKRAVRTPAFLPKTTSFAIESPTIKISGVSWPFSFETSNDSFAMIFIAVGSGLGGMGQLSVPLSSRVMICRNDKARFSCPRRSFSCWMSRSVSENIPVVFRVFRVTSAKGMLCADNQVSNSTQPGMSFIFCRLSSSISSMIRWALAWSSEHSISRISFRMSKLPRSDGSLPNTFLYIAGMSRFDRTRVSSMSKTTPLRVGISFVVVVVVIAVAVVSAETRIGKMIKSAANKVNIGEIIRRLLLVIVEYWNSFSQRRLKRSERKDYELYVRKRSQPAMDTVQCRYVYL
mmetsp:Transcript_21807/g.60582  ORF Transcript_21807/g.60582 Transcript_21807/m.60582 type:complete len:299 (-) Transcript_21807:12-908(-)